MIIQAIDWNVGPIIYEIKEFVLFGKELGPFSLRWYPLMFVISFVVGFQMVQRFYIKEKKNIKELDYLLIAVLLGTILGARFGEYIFYQPGEIFTNPLEVFLPIEFTKNGVKFVGFRGLASHGAVFGILIALYIYARKYKHNLMWIVDRVVIPTAFAAIFIRLGNFFNHEIVGIEAKNLPWAVNFHHMGENKVIPRHPAQLYESLGYIITFFILYRIYQKRAPRVPYGYFFGLFMILIFGIRFIVEFFKETQSDSDFAIFTQTNLKTGQILSIPMILVGLYFFFVYARGKGKQDMEKDLAKQK